MADELTILENENPANESDRVELNETASPAAPAEAAAPAAPAEAASPAAPAEAASPAAPAETPNKKYVNSGIADIVFLIDVTGSMRPCIEALKTNINKFIDMLTSTEGNGSPVTDWRARVVGYRDYIADGQTSYGWLNENVFTRDVNVLRHQLDALVAKGGLDEPESMLDAMMVVANAGAIDLQATGDEENSNKWRPAGTSARVVIVFTDATFHPKISIPGYENATLSDLINVYKQQRIKPYFFVPTFDIFDALEYMHGSIVNKCGEGGNGLKAVTEKPDVWQELLVKLAKGVTQTATAQVPL